MSTFLFLKLVFVDFERFTNPIVECTLIEITGGGGGGRTVPPKSRELLLVSLLMRESIGDVI